MKLFSMVTLSLMFFSFSTYANLLFNCENSAEIASSAVVLKSEALNFTKSSVCELSPGLVVDGLRLAHRAEDLAEEAAEGHTCFRLKMQFANVAHAYAHLKLRLSAVEDLHGPGLVESFYGLDSAYMDLKSEVNL